MVLVYSRTVSANWVVNIFLMGCITNVGRQLVWLVFLSAMAQRDDLLYDVNQQNSLLKFMF